MLEHLSCYAFPYELHPERGIPCYDVAHHTPATLFASSDIFPPPLVPYLVLALLPGQGGVWTQWRLGSDDITQAPPFQEAAAAAQQARQTRPVERPSSCALNRIEAGANMVDRLERRRFKHALLQIRPLFGWLIRPTKCSGDLSPVHNLWCWVLWRTCQWRSRNSSSPQTSSGTCTS